MLKLIDKGLNALTMYRVILYGLLVIAVFAIIFGFFGIIPFSGTFLTLSLATLLFVCALSNFVFAKIFKVNPNVESSYITALILFLIIIPPASYQDILTLIIVGVVAMLSKYLLAIHKRHIFNPAAIAIFLLGVFQSGGAIWWVATPALLPLTLIIGLLVVKKIRRFPLFLTFLFASVATVLFSNGYLLKNGFASLQEIFVSWPIIFFGTVMLTEPLTTPARKKIQIMYGATVGILFGAQFHIGPLFSSPEFALVAGNIFSFLMSPQKTLKLTLKEKVQLSENLHEFTFSTKDGLTFIPGQYAEWTLAHSNSDARGNRRYFTIASSPNEKEVGLGTKINSAISSSYKKALLNMTIGQSISLSQVTGDFILPGDKEKKLVFIAGGIGITPFRSMIQDLLDKKEKRDIILCYAVSGTDELVYQDVFNRAENEIGLVQHCIITQQKNVPKNWGGKTGRITPEMINKEIPDYKERTFYISGPNSMTEAYKKMLLGAGVKTSCIVTDYFPGF